MELSTAKDLMIMSLKDLYSAETQLVGALPKMAGKASSETLKKGFEEHLEETKEHIARLEKIADKMGENPKNHTCKAMRGLIEEGSELLEMEGNSDVIDAGLIGAAQRVEHYEIAAYGSTIELAKGLGEDEAAELMSQTLEEEKATDEKLNKVAEEEVNPAALDNWGNSEQKQA